jgi:hypothetical protein
MSTQAFLHPTSLPPSSPAHVAENHPHCAWLALSAEEDVRLVGIELGL